MFTLKSTIQAASAALLIAGTMQANAHHLDGVLLTFENGFEPFLFDQRGEIGSLPGIYDGGNFVRFNGSFAPLQAMDAVGPTNMVYVQFDLLVIGSSWTGNFLADAESRMQIEHRNTLLLDDTFSNVNQPISMMQTFGSTDGQPVVAGTGSTTFVNGELSVYHFSLELPDDFGLGDVFLDFVSRRGDGPGSSFGIDNLIMSAIPFDRDTDADGITDVFDNCTRDANPDQRDTDGDRYGNACDADLNNDCSINVVDLGLLRSVFFGTDANADFNGDGAVNFTDLGLMRNMFGGSPGPSRPGSFCDFAP